VFYAKLDTSPYSTPRVDSNVSNLISKIDEAKRATGQPKVILIAHSMGGLVATAYIEGNQYPSRDDVSRLFTFGTPHMGVNISTNWYGIVGAPIGMTLGDWVFKQQTLEDFKYDTRVRFLRDHPRRDRVEYHLISGNVSADSFTGSARTLADAFGDVPNDGIVPTRSGLGLPGTIDRLNITGANHGGYFAEGSQGRQCLRSILLDGRSDCGTVSTVTDNSLPASNPRCDAGAFIAILKTYNIGRRQINALAQFAGDCKAKGIRAFELAKEAAKQGLQVGFAALHLPGTILAATIASQSARYFAMTSPATLLVTTGSGQRAGVLNDGSIAQDIPDSQVLVIGDEEYVFYPPTAAVVSLHGTGLGAMTIEAVNADGGATSQAVAYQSVPMSPGLVAQVSTNDPQATLNIDSNGDGRVDQTRAPDIREGINGDVIGGTILPGPSYKFPQTGFTVSGRLWELWQGGRSFDDSLYINGFPITSLQAERSDTDGKVYQTQWFERARFELHSEKAAPYDVLLGLLGTRSVAGRQSEGSFKPVQNPGGGLVWFRETQHTLGDSSEGGRAIAAYWNRLGGLQQFGYPQSQPFFEWNQTENKSYLVQYFERQRFEYHPEKKGTRYEVLLGLLGAEQYRTRNFGPASGQLLHVETDGKYLKSAGVTVRDFEAEVTFYNPFDKAIGDWDIGMVLRATGNGKYDLGIISTGHWYIDLVTKSRKSIASGELKNLNINSGASNHIKVVASGNTGQIYVNGTLISTYDLSGHMEAGDITILTGWYKEHWKPGAITRYEGFTVRPLP
jgi:pimeloyl-ACP methyl ester carboxylesterase